MNQNEMQQKQNLKKGLLPIILLLIGCLLVSVWVIKNVPVGNADTAEMHLETLDMESLLSQGKPVLLNVSSNSCPYCVLMEPELEQIYTKYSDVAVIRDVNVDECPDAYMQIPVRATPMQVLFNADGTPYEPSEEIWQYMNFLYYMRQSDEAHVMTVHEGMLTAEQMELLLQDLGADV